MAKRQPTAKTPLLQDVAATVAAISSGVAKLAWAAGIVDGEGCICISRRTKKKGKPTQTPSYVLALKVKMTCQKTVRRIGEMFHGATYTVVKRSPDRRNEALAVTWQSQKAAKVLSALRPYMVTRADQANLALLFAELSRKHKPEIRRRREELYYRIKALKGLARASRERPDEVGTESAVRAGRSRPVRIEAVPRRRQGADGD